VTECRPATAPHSGRSDRRRRQRRVDHPLVRRPELDYVCRGFANRAFTNCASTRIRIYVDGEKKPSIDMELFMGAGIGFADPSAPWGTGKMGRTGDGDNVYNTYPIPF